METTDPGTPFDLGEAIVHSGPFGWFALLATTLLSIAGMGMIVTRKSQRSYVRLLLLSVIPVLSGAVGTVLGTFIVERAAEEKDLSEERIESGYEQAWLPTKMGGVGTLLLIGLCSVGLVQGRRDD